MFFKRKELNSASEAPLEEYKKALKAIKIPKNGNNKIEDFESEDDKIFRYLLRVYCETADAYNMLLSLIALQKKADKDFFEYNIKHSQEMIESYAKDNLYKIFLIGSKNENYKKNRKLFELIWRTIFEEILEIIKNISENKNFDKHLRKLESDIKDFGICFYILHSDYYAIKYENS